MNLIEQKNKKNEAKQLQCQNNIKHKIYELGWRGILPVAATAERIRERSINSSKWVRFTDLSRVRIK